MQTLGNNHIFAVFEALLPFIIYDPESPLHCDQPSAWNNFFGTNRRKKEASKDKHDACLKLVELLESVYFTFGPGILPFNWALSILSKCLETLGQPNSLEVIKIALEARADPEVYTIAKEDDSEAPEVLESPTKRIRRMIGGSLRWKSKSEHAKLQRSQTIAAISGYPSNKSDLSSSSSTKVRSSEFFNQSRAVKKVKFTIPDSESETSSKTIERRPTGPKLKKQCLQRRASCPEFPKFGPLLPPSPQHLCDRTEIAEVESMCDSGVVESVSEGVISTVDTFSPRKQSRWKTFRRKILKLTRRSSNQLSLDAISEVSELDIITPLASESEVPVMQPMPLNRRIRRWQSSSGILLNENAMARQRVATLDVFYNNDTKKAAETVVRRPRPSSLTSTPEGQHHSDNENNLIEIPTTASTPATPVDMTVEKRIRDEDAASDTASASSEDPSSTPDRPDPRNRMLIESGPGGDARTLSSAEFFAQLSQKFEARPKIQKLGEKLKTLLAPREQHHFAHFRRLFEGHIAEGDGLIMSFACNYKSQPRDFPVHGRMYLTLSMIGFSCQLLGYEKKILLPLRDIVVLEKDRTTNFFANSIKIVTATGDTHNFGSLKSRDRVYSLLFRVWRMNAEIDKRDLLVEDDDELDQLAPGTDASTVRHDSVHMAASDTTSESSADGTASNASTPSMAWPAPPSPSPVLPADCPCVEHKGRVLMDLEVPLTIHQVFNLLFTENKWLRKLDDQLKRSEKSHTPWSKNTFTEPKERNCTYVVELDKTFGPKCATVNEIQKYVPIGEGGIDGFTLHKEANNEGVPYADSFCVDCYYCVTRVTPTVTRIRVHGGVVFRKYIFGIIKTVIEKSTVHGLDAYYSALSDKLKADSARLPEMLATVNHDEEEHGHQAQHHHHMHHHHHLDAAEEATPTKPAPRFSDPSIVPVPATATHGVIGASPALSHELTSVVMLLRVIIILLSVLLITQFWFASHAPSAPAPPTDAFTLSTDISSLKSSVASLHAELQLLKSARAVADL